MASNDVFDRLAAAMPVEHPIQQNFAPVTNELGQTATFLSRALPTINKGVPVIRLRPRTKIPMDSNWPELATTDLSVIEKWNAETPDANCGAAAGVVWFFEVDSPNVIKRIEDETGQKMPKTYRVRSRKNRGHYYFKSTPESARLGNLSQGYVKHGDFSVRMDRQMVVAANSIHPTSGLPYEAVSNADIVEAPSWLLDWLRNQKVDKVEADADATAEKPAALVPHGAIHSYMMRESGKLRNQGLSVEVIEQVLLELVHKNCDPPIDEAKVRTAAQYMENYEPGKPSIILVDGQIPASGPSVSVAEVEDETEIVHVENKLPEFPVLTGLLAELSNSVCPDIPREFKLMSAVTIWGLIRSGRDTLEGEHLQPRFYTCFVKEPGWGKTAAINEIRSAMKMMTAMSTISVVPSVDSGPALVDELKELSDQAAIRTMSIPNQVLDKPRICEFAKCLLAPDEMTDLFEKAKQTAQSKNTLFSELLKLYEGNETGNRARVNQRKGKIVVHDAHLALLGGATPFGYETMWAATGGGATGLQSRGIVITTSAPKMPIKKTPTDYLKMADVIVRLNRLADFGPRVFKLSDEAGMMLQTWWDPKKTGDPAHDRVDDMVKRLLIVLAGSREDLDPFSDPLLVDVGLVELGCRFGDYVIACREKFNVLDSHSWIQAFELAIMKVARKHATSLTKNDFRRLTNADKRPGGLGPFSQGLRNLIENGMLILDGQNRQKQDKYRPEKR